MMEMEYVREAEAEVEENVAVHKELVNEIIHTVTGAGANERKLEIILQFAKSVMGLS